MKNCTKCGDSKPLEDFSNRKAAKDGKRSQCKMCDRAATRDWRDENPDRARDSVRKWREENIEAARANSRRWYRENTERSQENTRKWRAGNPERCASSAANRVDRRREYLREYRKRYYEQNREREREWSRHWHIANREHKAAKSRQWRENNPGRIQELSRRWRESNSEAKSASAKRWHAANRERTTERLRNRRREDPQVNLATKIRNRISGAIRRCQRGSEKAGATISLLGCSFNEFKVHIERQFTRGMTWEKLMKGEIHLDHIRPISSFDLTDPEQQADAFNYLNVMPLWAKANLSKSNRITTLL